MVALTILAIALTFIALFILPFFFVSSKFFKDKDMIFKTYASMAIGLFTSIAIVYLLIGLGVFTKISFLVVYLPIIALINFYFLRGSKWKDFDFNIKPHWIIPSILLLIAFCLGFYIRFYDPITHISLGVADPWAHFLWTKQVIAKGDIFWSGYGSDYPKGLHIILSLIHFYSGSSIYSICRFAGALFGVISIGGIYCLISYISNGHANGSHIYGHYAGAFAAFAYASFARTGVPGIINRQTRTMPEVLAFILMILALLFALEIIRGLGYKQIQKRNIILFIASVTSLALIHPLTMWYTSSLLFLLFILSLVFHKNIRRSIKAILILIILSSLGAFIVRARLYIIDFLNVAGYWTRGMGNIQIILPTFDTTIITFFILLALVGFATYSILHGLSKRKSSYLLASAAYIPFFYMMISSSAPFSRTLILVLLLSACIATYGIFKRKMPYVFAGISCILFAFTMATDFLVLFSPYRTRIFLGFIGSCIIGVVAGEILRKVGNISRYTKILGETLGNISRSKLCALYYILLSIVVSGYLGRESLSIMHGYYPDKLTMPIVSAMSIFIPLIVGSLIAFVIKAKLEITGERFFTVHILLFSIGLSGYLCRDILGRMNYVHPTRVSTVIALIIGSIVALVIKSKSTSGLSMRFGMDGKRALKVLIGLTLFLFLILSPYAPPVSFRIGYEDCVNTTLKICEDFPLENVTIFSESIGYWINRERAIIQPKGNHNELYWLITSSPSEYVSKNEYTFIFIEKIPYSLRIDFDNSSIITMENAKEWIDDYKENHNDIVVYYESKEIIVYLIEKK